VLAQVMHAQRLLVLLNSCLLHAQRLLLTHRAGAGAAAAARGGGGGGTASGAAGGRGGGGGGAGGDAGEGEGTITKSDERCGPHIALSPVMLRSSNELEAAREKMAGDAVYEGLKTELAALQQQLQEERQHPAAPQEHGLLSALREEEWDEALSILRAAEINSRTALAGKGITAADATSVRMLLLLRSSCCSCCCS